MSNNQYSPLREDSVSVIDESKATMLNRANDSLAPQNFSNNILLTPLNANQQTPSRSRSPSPSNPRKPLLLGQNNTSAPLANVETDDETDDREVVNRPYPGVDDGFFSNGNEDGTSHNNTPGRQPESSGDPEVEFVPTHREPEEPSSGFPEIPNITPRLGPDGGSANPPDETDGKPSIEQPSLPPASQPGFPISPGFRPWGVDMEFGGTLPSGESIPDLNVYQHKKTLAQGMMDLALFSANANQLRYVLETFRNHPYYYPSLILISISLILQVAVGIGLVWNATYNVKDKKALCLANKINNFTVIGVFLVTVINVFISAFGVAPAPA